MRELVQMLSYSFLFPPTLFVVTALIGTLLALRWRRIGVATSLVSLVLFMVLAMPFVANRLIALLERQVPAAGPGLAPGAIVVLGADTQARSSQPGLLTLERLFMAAHEYRASHLPILTSGGGAPAGESPLADVMAQILKDDFGVPVRWRESESRTTYENAKFAAAILRPNGISVVVLVAQRWDMPRAVWAFRRFGITAVPAKEAHAVVLSAADLSDFIPHIGDIEASFIALHELLGLRYYRAAYSEPAVPSGPPRQQ